MREIKFRAWQPTLKEMWPHEQIEYRAAIVQHNAEALILMQYTGLQDKNGQDIYEGDIVRAEWTSNNSTIELVQWSEYDAGFELKGDHGMEESGLWLEVIGNIHANPELINPIQESTE